MTQPTLPYRFQRLLSDFNFLTQAIHYVTDHQFTLSPDEQEVVHQLQIMWGLTTPEFIARLKVKRLLRWRPPFLTYIKKCIYPRLNQR